MTDLTDVAMKFENNQPRLFISSEEKSLWDPVAGIWRLGAVKPPWQFIPTLEILNGVSEVFPMLNPAISHQIAARRVRMFSILSKKTTLPLVSLHAFITGRYLIESGFKPSFPLVLKIGNYEGGLMKWKIVNEDQWSDFFDSFRAFDEPIIIEEFIPFHTEYRSLFIGDDIYLIKRDEIRGWRAQHAKKSIIIKPSDEIIEMTHQAKDSMNMSIGALDFVESNNGYTVFEINDCPNINHVRLGIDQNLWSKSAELLVNKIER